MQSYVTSLLVLQGGLEQNQRILFIGHGPADHERIWAFLIEAELDAIGFERSEQLTYLPCSAIFDADRFDERTAIDYLAAAVDEAVGAGYSALRLMVDMSWSSALKDFSVIHRFESALTQRLNQLPVVTVCMYQSSLFHPEVLTDILQCHPHVLLEDSILENMYYLPLLNPSPDELSARTLDLWMSNLRLSECRNFLRMSCIIQFDMTTARRFVRPLNSCLFHQVAPRSGNAAA